jgi:uncharacterized membrane protein YdjX (TVP38/TMEM64 family)
MLMRSPLAAGTAAACVVAAVVLASLVLPIDDWLRMAGERLAQAGVLGGTAIVVGSVLLAATGLPTSPLTLIAGLLYGAWALPVVWAIGVVLAAVSFEAARWLFGDATRQALSRRPRLERIAQVADEEGWRVVLLLRASGLAPFAIQNYAFGCLTRIPLLPFISATAVGIIPGIVLAGAVGVAARSAAELNADYYRIAGLTVMAVAASALVGLAARRLGPHLRSARLEG